MPPDNPVVFKRKLSDALIRSLTEPGKHADGEVTGFYLEVRASNKIGKSPSKFWCLKYRLHGKENRFSIGAYSDIGLKDAGDITAHGFGATYRTIAHEQLGIDPIILELHCRETTKRPERKE